MNSFILDFSMRRFGLYIVGILVVVFVVCVANDVVNSVLVVTSPSNNAYKMKRLVEGGERSEICILGNSRAQEHFLPSEIAPEAFNYGLAGSGWRDLLFHIRVALARPGSDVVICNIDPLGLALSGCRGDYRFVCQTDIYKSEEQLPRVSWKNILPGIRFFGSLRMNIAENEWINGLIGGKTKTFDHGAIIQRNKTRSDEEWEFLESKLPELDFHYHAEVDERLQGLLRSNRRHEVVFVVSPLAEPWLKHYKGEARFLEYLNRLGKLPHVHVCDYRGYGWKLSDFMDMLHLNEQGARRFSQLVKRDLTKMGILPFDGQKEVNE